MNEQRIKQSVKEWKRTKNRGAIVHQAEMINEQIHIRTIRIRECKQGMTEADRVYTLMQKAEQERLAEMEASHIRDKRMVNYCMNAIKKGAKYDLDEPVLETPPPKKEAKPIIIPDPVEEIIAEPEPEPIIEPEVIELTPEGKEALIAQKEAELEELLEFPCEICGRIYATEPALKRHMTMRHKED